MPKQRCDWGETSPLMQKYHDKEWGKPTHNDTKLFEAFLLDMFQAGLSWATILNKRANFKKAFDSFDVKKIARYTRKKEAALLKDEGIIRNRLKVAGIIKNANVVLQIQKEFGSFDSYVWQFVGGKPIVNKWKRMKDIPVHTKEAEMLSKDLKSRGATFVGPTCMYAFMQGVGMVNDHTTDCFRYKELVT